MIALEYGHAWTHYRYYVTQQHTWDLWLIKRGLYGNALLGTSYLWSIREMIADDYRLLFGTQAAEDGMVYINPEVADPHTMPGLKDWFITQREYSDG